MYMIRIIDRVVCRYESIESPRKKFLEKNLEIKTLEKK